jgi:hypothetical protein
VKGLDKSGVWVFPQLLLCLDCGVADFQIGEKEIVALRGHNTEAPFPHDF